LGVLLGAFLGAVGAFLFVMGVFLPYLAGWGGRELEDFGGNDFAPDYWLKCLLVYLPVYGAVVCGASGFIAWALRFLRPDRWG
jgi:NhaP-type Na+/H+ or K+/H+ antiporter